MANKDQTPCDSPSALHRPSLVRWKRSLHPGRSTHARLSVHETSVTAAMRRFRCDCGVGVRTPKGGKEYKSRETSPKLKLDLETRSELGLLLLFLSMHPTSSNENIRTPRAAVFPIGPAPKQLPSDMRIRYPFSSVT